MKWNKNLIIYIYDASENTQNAALGTLVSLQYYEVKEFDISQSAAILAARQVLEQMPQSTGEQKKIRDRLISLLEHAPQDIETPIMVTSEKIILLKEDGRGSFQNEINWLKSGD